MNWGLRATNCNNRNTMQTGMSQVFVFNKSVKKLSTGCDKTKRTKTQWTKSEQQSQSFDHIFPANIQATKLTTADCCYTLIKKTYSFFWLFFCAGRDCSTLVHGESRSQFSNTRPQEQGSCLEAQFRTSSLPLPWGTFWSENWPPKESKKNLRQSTFKYLEKIMRKTYYVCKNDRKRLSNQLCRLNVFWVF